MNKLHTILLVSSLIPGLFVSATAQTTSPERNVPVLPSPRGNYLLVSPIETTPTDSATLRNTAYFLIERTEITEKVLEKRMAPPLKPSTDTLQESKSVSDLTYREVGRLRQVSSMQEVRRVFSEASIADLKKMTKQPTDGQLITYLQTHPNVASYPFFEGRIELQLLLGYAFLDEGVQPGGLYFYRVTQVDKNNRKTLWSEAIAVAGAENERLKTIRVNTRAANLSLTDPAFRQHVAFHIAEPKTLTAQVKYREGNVWKSGGRLLPVLNKTGDSLEVYWQKRCVPDEVVRASLVLQDIVYNPGTPSDTSLAFAVSAGKLALIYKATARDTTDAIRVSWPRLPRKPYYTGIELSRSTDSTFAVVARLTATDTLYTDYHVRPGVPYIYHVKPLFAG